jgi:nucleoside-diphosphate-sugar epimerase
VSRPGAGPRALVIGGTGPTGPLVVDGLTDRGYDVTILHGGQHEAEFRRPVRHIHEDPHFEEPLRRGLGTETYDLVIAQYGRLRVIADVLAGRTGRLIAIGGATGIFARDDPRWGGLGRPALFPETTEIFEQGDGTGGAPGGSKIGLRMAQAMTGLFDHHAAGHYQAAYLMYPVNYGPRNPGPYDWCIVRRILDGRGRIVIADGGQKLESRVSSENAAHAVLTVADQPDAASGRRYIVADRYVYSMRQRIEFIARHLGADVELVDLPWDAAWPCHPYWRRTPSHNMCQSVRIREELGYCEQVEPDVAFGRAVDWLAANRPEPGGEAERQVGDPFDYRAEDELIRSWESGRAAMSLPKVNLPEAGHQYRHPKTPGESWRPGPTVR